ncbi:MAG TPA: AbgT family transporter [Candidatus Polarisedimenticolaceae bacterium]|nr:AbgT family transporter [Candidatus Polarisedimenticolaceae bacterium]
MRDATKPGGAGPKAGWIDRALGRVERAGNRLPDPAMLFVLALVGVWIVSWLLAGHPFTVPARDGDRMLEVQNQATGSALATALSTMVSSFTGFPPLGVVLWAAAWPADSPLHAADGSITSFGAPIMQSIVPLIFLLFLFPAIVYGYIGGTVRSHRDLIVAMTKSMQTMGYYLVMIFFCAQFTAAFGRSNLGALLAVEGADLLRALGLSGFVTIVGIILLTSVVNLLVGSASGKWALLAPIFVPILMQLGLSPELTQAAYRVGDSTTNIITPLMPYFPLVVAFAQRWVRGSGIGTITSLMLPYTVSLLVSWTIFLVGDRSAAGSTTGLHLPVTSSR